MLQINVRLRNGFKLNLYHTQGKFNRQPLDDIFFFFRKQGLFVCVEVLWPSQPNGVMSSVVSLPNHTFPGQA